MEGLQLPSKIEYQAGANERMGTFVLEPLFPGYGTTIGNALRRVLLSSLPGAAVTAVRVRNAPHEFTTLPQVQEDILQIILNLKALRLKVFSSEPVMLNLKIKGEREVKASDISPNSDVQIVNQALTIAPLTSRNAELEMDIWVSQGRGYVPTEVREKEKMDIGTIAIDALYAPIRQVTFQIEPARVGQMTNYDKLVFALETDGTLSPEVAVAQATAILLDHFTLIQSSLEGVRAATSEASSGAPEAVGNEGEGEAAPKKRRRKKPDG